jgi:uncharacterized membrane protein YagU involved in acid resistance
LRFCAGRIDSREEGARNEMTMTIGNLLLTSLVAGVLGGLAMEVVLWLIGAAGWAKADMVVALGSLLTKSRANAWRVGALVHFISAVGFALGYVCLMLKLDYTHLPASMMFGAGIGFVHGLVVSLGLVWVVAERHPLEEFNEAGLAIGLSHIVGHVVYGAVVGVIVSLAPVGVI